MAGGLKKTQFGPASRPHLYLAKAMGATMWFWIFYRMKQDGAVLFVSSLFDYFAKQLRDFVILGEGHGHGHHEGDKSH